MRGNLKGNASFLDGVHEESCPTGGSSSWADVVAGARKNSKVAAAVVKGKSPVSADAFVKGASSQSTGVVIRGNIASQFQGAEIPLIGTAGVVLGPKSNISVAGDGGFSLGTGTAGPDEVKEAALGRWALLITAMVTAARNKSGVKACSQEEGQFEDLAHFGPIDYQGVKKQGEDELVLYGDAKELQDLHKDLCDAKYSNSEIEEVVPLHFLYKSEQQQTHASEGDGLSSLDDYDDDTFFRDNKPTNFEDRAPSLDAIFYDDSGPKTSKKKKKYKRRDWESMLPPGGPRCSGRVKTRSAFSMFSGMEEASI